MRGILLTISILLTLFERIVLAAVFSTNIKIDVVILFWITILYLCFKGREKTERASDLVLPIFISGLLFDFLSGSLLGLHSFLFLLIGLCVSILVQRIPFQNYLFLFPLIIIVVSIFYNGFIYIFNSFTSGDFSFTLFEFLWRSVAANLLGGIIIFPLGAFILRKASYKSDVEVGA